MTALMIKAIKVPRMARVTWYKHRALVLGIPGLYLLAAALLVIDSVLQRHWVSSHHLTYCLAYADNSTSSRCLTQNSPYTLGVFAGFVDYWRTEGTVLAVFLLAAVTGLFAGVPWVAREFEGGGFRFTWTQSVSPRRWLLGTFGPLTVLAGPAAAICGVAAPWWFQVAQFRLDGGTTPWGWESFEMTPLSMVSWTLLAMALALLLGVTIRRVLPAMIAFAVTFGGCLVLAQTWLPEFLFRVGTIPLRLNSSTQGVSHQQLRRADVVRPSGRAQAQYDDRIRAAEQLPAVARPGSLAHPAPPQRMGRLPAAQPPGLARARPQRHPGRDRRPCRPHLGLVAPQAPGRMKSGSAGALRR
jgi:hypothetical protein